MNVTPDSGNSYSRIVIPASIGQAAQLGSELKVGTILPQSVVLQLRDAQASSDASEATAIACSKALYYGVIGGKLGAVIKAGKLITGDLVASVSLGIGDALASQLGGDRKHVVYNQLDKIATNTNKYHAMILTFKFRYVTQYTGYYYLASAQLQQPVT